MPGFVGVALEFRTTVNPEPGVARAPTLAEQTNALDRLALRLGDGLAGEILVARQGEGLGPQLLDEIARRRPAGVVLFSLETVQRDHIIDLAALQRCWACGGVLGLLVENLAFTAPDEFDAFADYARSMNLVRQRDRSVEWLGLVGLVGS